MLAALTVSGLPSDRFLFAGFPPASGGSRQSFLETAAASDATVILYESPKRLQKLLGELGQYLEEDRPVVVCRELTKRFEEVLRRPLGALVAALSGRALKGECVVVVAPPDPDAAPAQDDLRMALMAALRTATVRDAATEVALRFGVPRKGVYQLALQIAAGNGDDAG